MQNKFKLPLLLGLTMYGAFTGGVCFAANDHLQNAAQGQCLHAVNNTNSIYVQNCVANEPKQIWTYNDKRQLVNNGRCLNATSLNGPVVLSTCRTRAAMTWTYDAVTQGYKNSKYNQCLDVSGYAVDGRVLTWGCSTGTNQQWKFFSESPPDPTQTWLQHDLKLDGIGVGVVGVNKVLMASLGNGFDTPTNYTATINYGRVIPGYTFSINGTPLNNGFPYTFTRITYGSSVPIERRFNGVLVDTYDLVFTNLPVIQLNARLINDEPKLPGTLRLMSRQFNQDTAVQNMGIEIRGQTSQVYPKKSYSLQIGTASDWTAALDFKLLDMRTDSDWILDAAYRDQSFARNIVSHDIFRSLHPVPYTGATSGQSSIKGQLTEVIKNEVYQGVYVLTEKPDRKLYGLKKITGPVDAAGNVIWNQVDFTNPDNGSVLYKASSGECAFCDAADDSRNFEQIYPKPTDMSRLTPLMELTNFIATSSDADFAADIGNRIDLDSVVDWWSLVVLSNGADNMKKNFMLGKSGSKKFFMATWDHDATFGMFWDGSVDKGIYNMGNIQNVDQNNLIKRLITLPASGFNAKFKTRWAALRASTYSQTELAARFDSYITQAAKGGATARNKISWPDTGAIGSGNPELGTTAFINNALAIRLPLADQFVNALP